MSIKIVIVGAGHYAMDLIMPQYIKHNNFTIKAVISPKTAIQDFTCYKTVKQYKDACGYAIDEVFDLCVHTNKIITIMKSLIAIKAKNFILPKPIALSREDLCAISLLEKQHNLKIAVASQYAIDNGFKDFTKSLKIKSIEFVFSQTLKKYSVFSSFLPHILQMCSLPIGKPKIEFIDKHKLELHYMAGKVKVFVKIDNLSVERHRFIKLCLNKGSAIMSLANNNSFPAMLDGMYGYFKHDIPTSLSLKEYLPVAKKLIEVVEAC